MARLIRPRALVALLVLDLLVLVALGAIWSASRGQAGALDDYGAAPAVALTDQRGRAFSSDDTRGAVVVADFVYTNCGDTCPLLSVRMRALQEQLREEGMLGDRVWLLSFSTDPERDTPRALRAYAARYGADPEAWRFLTGNEREMERVVVGGFKLGVEEVALPEGSPHAGDGAEDHHRYDVMHSNKFVLVDRQGRIRAYYDGLDLDVERVVGDIRTLLS